MKNQNKIKLFIKFCIWIMIALFCKGVAEANYPKKTETPVVEVMETPQQEYPAIIGLIAPTEDLYIKYFGERADEAKRVAKCESGMNPNAHNLKTDDRGLMQINYSTWHKVFGDVDYYDPETNIKLASEIYARSGSWNPWSSSRKCHNL